MKKIFIVLLASGIMFSGCSKDKSRSKTADNEQTSAQTVSENTSDISETIPVSEHKPIEHVLEPADGTYVYDNAKLFSAEDAAFCNDYAEFLYENFLINAAVVTTSVLDGRSPEDFAAEAYNRIYGGKGSGLLLLINNDTNKDILYKTGSCLRNIEAADENEAFYWSTRDIVEGDYKTAVHRLMQLGENCPQHVFDNGGILSDETLTSLEVSLVGYKNDVSILATTNSTDMTNEELLKSYYERRYHDGKGYMVMLDAKTSSVSAYSKEPMPTGYEDVLKKANELVKKGDAKGALINAADALKG